MKHNSNRILTFFDIEGIAMSRSSLIPFVGKNILVACNTEVHDSGPSVWIDLAYVEEGATSVTFNKRSMSITKFQCWWELPVASFENYIKKESYSEEDEVLVFVKNKWRWGVLKRIQHLKGIFPDDKRFVVHISGSGKPIPVIVSRKDIKPYLEDEDD